MRETGFFQKAGFPQNPFMTDHLMSSTSEPMVEDAGPLPPWLRVKIKKAALTEQTGRRLGCHGVATVCERAHCPNIGECYSRGTATFLIMGTVCTRNCRFCAIDSGRPEPLDPDEPQRVAEAVADLGLDFVVVTSVTRDDLPDGGAGHFAATIRAIRGRLPEAGIEVLTPDFSGDTSALRQVLEAKPTVFNHNVETVPRLQPEIRPQADYDRSLGMLAAAHQIAPPIPTKSGLIVGMGETADETRQTMTDLAGAGVSILTIGQYLQPTRRHRPVSRYVPPDEFALYEQWGRQTGLAYVLSGPFVRSSYHAAEAAQAVLAK